MKTNSTLMICLRATFFFAWVFCFSFPGAAQAPPPPDYTFTNPVLESGTDLLEGAIYRFSDVKPGVDARVQVKKFSGGVTLNAIDETWTGFKEAFQPFIDVPPSSDGYVEFEITFVKTATNSSLNQLEVPVTAIDIDGVKYADGILYEQDQIQIVNGYVDFEMAGGQLLVTQPSGWVVAKNTTGISLPGVDTLDKRVMVTGVNANISKFSVRVGARNTSPTDGEVRYRSLYFRKFIFPNSVILPLPGVSAFRGVAGEEKINLQWSLAAGSNVSNITLEKSYSNNAFQNLAEFPVNDRTNFTYVDNKDGDAAVYYRLKITLADGKVEYSNILRFNSQKTAVNSLDVYPSQVASSVTARIRSSVRQPASFEVFDYSGRVVYRQQIGLQEGDNNIQINNLDRLPSGNYITAVRTNEKIYSRKINKL